MGGAHSLYVRTGSIDEIRSIVPAWIDIELDEHCDYACLSNADDWTELARKLSAGGRDVIELGFQSTVDAFRYVRYAKGAAARLLQYGWSETEQTWEHVAGSPETWESVFEAPPKVGLFMSLTAMDIAAAAGMHHKLTHWYYPPPKPKKKAQKKKKSKLR